MSDPSLTPAGARLSPTASAQRWILAAAATGLTTGIADLVRSRLSGTVVRWPTLESAAVLLAGHTAMASVILLVGAVAMKAGSAARTRWSASTTVALLARASIIAVVLALPLWWAGDVLASGAWISQQSFAPLVRVGPLIAGVIAACVVAGALGMSEAGGIAATRTTAAGVSLGVLLVLVDIVAAPGQFPEFHMMLHVGVAASLVVGLAGLARRWAEASSPWSARVAVAWLVLGPLMWFGASQRARTELILYSSIARDWITIATPYAKPRPLRDALADIDVLEGAVDFGREGEQPAGELAAAREMNVLLVVVDTLRADALAPVRPSAGTEFAQPGDTPFLDAQSETAFRFTRCYASATVTHLSMPSFFRSIQPSDDPLATGTALGVRAEEHGFVPLAVVPEYFLASKYPSATGLLDGFVDVAVYERQDVDTLVDSTRRLLERTGDRRFFAWLHFYNMHDPGFDGRILTKSDGSRKVRYRSSLQWLDREMRRLFEMLVDLGVADNTIVIIASDHGEGLGEHGRWLHGPTVFEHDVHVPLLVWIPGVDGFPVDHLASNVDIVPTIFDLAGATPESSDVGTSLLPSMLSARPTGSDDSSEEKVVGFVNSQNTAAGVVSGSNKLIMERRGGFIYRFDVVEDPDETSSLFDPEATLDKWLLRRLIEFNPDLAAAELADEDTAALLVQRLEEVDPTAPGTAVPFLLRLAALRPTAETRDAVARIFEESDDHALRLLVVRHAFESSPKRFDRLISKWLDDVSGSPDELGVIASLARQGQPAVARKIVTQRMTHWAKAGPPESWEPFLLLVRPWHKSARYYVEPLKLMLTRANEPGVTSQLRALILANVAQLEGKETKKSADLAKLCRSHLGDSDARVRASAYRALGGLDDEPSIPAISTALANDREDQRVRREAAGALAKIAGADAIPKLVAVADDPALAMIVVRRLGEIGATDALEFLRETQKKSDNSFLRNAARRSIETIENRNRSK